MPVGMGQVEPIAIKIALDDWARSVRRWSALIGEQPALIDNDEHGRKRARFCSRNFASLDLVEAGGDAYRGDCEITFIAHDLPARLRALEDLGIPFDTDAESGDVRVAGKFTSGVDVVFSRHRSEQVGREIAPLPYVIDIAVIELDASVPVWTAVLGDAGVATPIETDSARQFRMHHYLVDGETHAVGLMQLDREQFIKRDSLGSSQEFILDTRGEGLLCLGFLYTTDLDDEIAAIPEREQELLQFEEPRSYLMGRNNMAHADACGGVSVVIAQHFEGWKGDLDSVGEYEKPNA